MYPPTILSALSFLFLRSVARPLFALCLLFWLLPSPLVRAQTGAGTSVAGQSEAEARTLKVGEPVERELTGGQQHAYQITLSAGQYLNVAVEQRGIDVAIVLIGPDGKQIFEFDNERRNQGPEIVWQVAELSGNFRLTLRGTQKGAPAGRYEIRLVELRAATEQDRTLQEARKLYAEGDRLWRASKSNDARPLIERSLEMREQVLGPEHPDVAQSLNRLATIHYRLVELDKAEPLYQRALAIREKALGLDHPDVAASLTHLALLYRVKGDYAKAKLLYPLALAISQKALEQMHPDFGSSFLDALATLYSENSDYAKAEPLLQRKLIIFEKVLGLDHPDLVEALNDLARIYSDKGDYVKAEPLLQRALTIGEKAGGPEHRDLAGLLTNLGVLYEAKGDYAKAEPLFQRTLIITEKALGPKASEVALPLLNLGGIYAAKGDYEKAEPLLQRALAISEEWSGPEGDKVAFSLRSLAYIYRKKGDYVKAEPLLQRALTITEKWSGPEHPAIYSFLQELSLFYEAKGEITRAINFESRASALSERSIALNLATGSERQKLALLAGVSSQSNHIVSLHIRAAPTDPAARNLALTTILQRKGRALDVITDSIAALRRRASTQDQALLDQYRDAKTQLAKLVLGGPQKATQAEHQGRIKNQQEEVEKLEDEVGRRSTEFAAQAQPVTLTSIQSAIPADAALVEFFAYRPFNPKFTKVEESFGQPRYVAYVLHRQGEAKWAELGEAKAIDESVGKLRQALRDKQRKDVKQLARVVDEKVMRPVRALLGSTNRVFISPDGALNLIPFAALVDEHNRYLVQRYTFSYLTSGRDLLRLQVKQPSKQTAMVVANPDFGEETKAGAAQQRLLKYRPGTKAATGEGAVLSGYYFPPLQGTAGEARALKAMMRDATVLTQAQATETALKQVSSPRILHIATHGFFLENQKPSSGEDRLLRPMSSQEPVVGQIENPLLRSGLALAGANLQKNGEGDDGILTAQEAAGLDLWGTKLVVLSACDTGIGEVKNGEGVYGLRRALVLAGSETQVMSLWPVSDKATRDLMIEYYRRLLKGEGRSAALRQVQLRMLKAAATANDDQDRLLVTKSGKKAGEKSAPKDYSHPYYWASFIQSGEWANLEGKR